MLSPHHRVGYLSCNSEDADIRRPCFLCHVYFEFILFILISLVIYSICNPPDKMSSSYLIYSPLPQQSPGNNFFIYIYTIYNGTLFPSVMETLKTCFHKIHDSHQAGIHLVASNLEIDLLHFSRNRCPGYFLWISWNPAGVQFNSTHFLCWGDKQTSLLWFAWLNAVLKFCIHANKTWNEKNDHLLPYLWQIIDVSALIVFCKVCFAKQYLIISHH